MTAPARLDRAGFDALVQRRVMALSEAAVRMGEEAVDLSARQDAAQEAQMLETEATLFADAVDASGLSYGEAVVIFGTSGPVVVHVDEYDREPVYHQARAGEVELIVSGPYLLGLLDR